MARIPVPVSLAPEGLNRHLERNVGFLTPPLWIASRNELSSIPGVGIALFFGPVRAWQWQKLFGRPVPFRSRPRFFPRTARAKRHIPSALMASITLI
jgi:hypothetical protein